MSDKVYHALELWYSSRVENGLDSEFQRYEESLSILNDKDKDRLELEIELIKRDICMRKCSERGKNTMKGELERDDDDDYEKCGEQTESCPSYEESESIDC